MIVLKAAVATAAVIWACGFILLVVLSLKNRRQEGDSWAAWVRSLHRFLFWPLFLALAARDERREQQAHEDLFE